MHSCPLCQSTKRLTVPNILLCSPCYHENIQEAFLKERNSEQRAKEGKLVPGEGPKAWEEFRIKQNGPYFVSEAHFKLDVDLELQIAKTCKCRCPARIEHGEDSFHGMFELHCVECNAQAYLLPKYYKLD